jgi:two-component system sensor histidine kinase RegB
MDQLIKHKNLRLLILLRWIAIIGTLVLVWLVSRFFHMVISMHLIAIIIGLMTAFNFISFIFVKIYSFAERTMFIFLQLIFDILIFTFILYCTGGMMNPFTGLYLIHIILAAILLPPFYCWITVVLTGASYLFIAINHIPIRYAHHVHSSDLHYQGMIVSYLVSAVLVAYFVVKMSKNIRNRDLTIQKMTAQIKENALVSEFGLVAANTAHELGTPLSTIYLNLDDIIQDHPKLSSDQRIKKIKSQIHRCKYIIRDTLSNFRQHTKEEILQDLRSFIDKLIQKSIQYYPGVKISVDKQLDQTIEISSSKLLEQSINTVIENAANASPANVNVLIFSKDEHLCFCIQDKGAGISEEITKNMSNLDVPFSSSTMGMGLKLAFFMITRLKGTLTFDVDKGTKVNVRIPLKSLMIESEK